MGENRQLLGEYFKPFLLSPKRIMLIGANFDTDTGILSNWQNEELAGKKE